MILTHLPPDHSLTIDIVILAVCEHPKNEASPSYLYVKCSCITVLIAKIEYQCSSTYLVIFSSVGPGLTHIETNTDEMEHARSSETERHSLRVCWKLKK